MFREKMQTPAIPERVYALCCALKKKQYKRDELRMRIEPEGFANTSYFSEVLNAAKELDLIVESEKVLSLAIDKKVLDNQVIFRKFIGPLVLDKKDSLFYKVTKAYLEMNQKVFEYNSVADMEQIIREKISLKNMSTMDRTDMHAWRFWASFLGIGILHDMLIIPNLYVYLLDRLEESDISINQELSVKDFFSYLAKMEFALPDNQNKLSFALSIAIRQLHDEGIIELKYQLDSSEVWFLFEMEEHKYNKSITHVTRRR